LATHCDSYAANISAAVEPDARSSSGMPRSEPEASPTASATGGANLTPRERDVLVELCRPALTSAAFSEPASIRDIATALFVTEGAVKQHMLRLYDKFGIDAGVGRRRLHLANEAIRRRIVSVGDLGAERVSGQAADLLAAGRAALAQRDWHAAYENLSNADAAGIELRPADLTGLGEAALWSGNVEASQAARLRAYNAYAEAGDDRKAAVLALDLVINHLVSLRFTVASGWVNKARRHLGDSPECVERGHLAAVESMFLLAEGRFDRAIESATLAFDIGRQYSSNELTALGLVFQANALAQTGRPEEAMPLFDEAMASASSGELDPLTTGIIYCRTLGACVDLFDYQRALDLAAEIDRACENTGAVGFPGDCRAHRAQVLIVLGAWKEATQEATAACTEAKAFDLGHVGMSQVQLGLLHLRSGRLDEAEAAFQLAREHGVVPEPGQSLLSLERGDPDAAARGIASALAEAESIPLRRAQLLPALTQISLFRGDRETASIAASELERIAHDYGTPALRAAAHCARGAVAAASGDLHGARTALREGLDLWSQLGAPYEAATARVMLADVLAAQADELASLGELRSAKDTFERLGALNDAKRLADRLPD
jgi:tetratricopeptide (TPR) repeat protein